MRDDPLALMLDELLPGGDGFPRAGALNLGDWLRGRAEWAATVHAVVAILPAEFCDVHAEERAGILLDVESHYPDLFARMIVGVYSGYYTHPVVRAVIDLHTGYPIRPPQPKGYALQAFDPAVLDRVRQGPASYRKT
jgi:hypothetical protein